jgi:hypothetical protein
MIIDYLFHSIMWILVKLRICDKMSITSNDHTFTVYASKNDCRRYF